jgi:hypothetical protein
MKLGALLRWRGAAACAWGAHAPAGRCARRGVLSRDARERVRPLERFFSQACRRRGSGGGGGASPRGAAAAGGDLLCVLRELAAGVGGARTEGEAPDPAEVPEFVSLGEARAALEEGALAVERILLALAGGG